MQPPDTGCLVFLHIPKTGGTSLIEALRRRFPARAAYSDHGNLTAALVQRHRAALREEALFHGHAHHGIAARLAPARLSTVLRRPAEQAVSNYLYLRREPRLPLHAAARAMTLQAFLRRHWQFLAFQAISLDVAQADPAIHCREDLAARLPRIEAFLDRIDHVGCLDHLDEFMRTLAILRGWRAPPQVGRRNTARRHGIRAPEVAGLMRAYDALGTDPDLAPLMAAEEAVYARARALSARQHEAALPGAQQAGCGATLVRGLAAVLPLGAGRFPRPM